MLITGAALCGWLFRKLPFGNVSWIVSHAAVARLPSGFRDLSRKTGAFLPRNPHGM
jgi:hypothetical protein